MCEVRLIRRWLWTHYFRRNIKNCTYCCKSLKQTNTKNKHSQGVGGVRHSIPYIIQYFLQPKPCWWHFASPRSQHINWSIHSVPLSKLYQLTSTSAMYTEALQLYRIKCDVSIHMHITLPANPYNSAASPSIIPLKVRECPLQEMIMRCLDTEIGS